MENNHISSKVPFIPPLGPLGNSGKTVGDFWSWAYSDLLCDTIRPILAEYLVGLALELTENPRVEWNFVDFNYGPYRIEVKSSAYVQTWEQEKESSLKFDIAKKEGWNADTNEYSSTPDRWANCYIFCVLGKKGQKEPNTRNLDDWYFWVMSTEDINHHFGEQKSVALSRIESVVGESVGFDQLKKKVDEVLGTE